MTYPHVYIICKDCMVKGYLYEIIKGKNTIEDIMKVIEKFRLEHAGHNLIIVDYNDIWYEDNFDKLRDVIDE